MTLTEKIDHSIALIRKTEKLALALQPSEGFLVGFSGGKDSQVVLDLAKTAGVRFRAVYNVTTNDPAENVRFIKHHYPDVEFSIPEKSYLQMIEHYGVPTMKIRWCCAIFKESSSVGYAILLGVRRQESRKRAQYEEISQLAKNKKARKTVDYATMEEHNFQCVGGKDKFMIYPILNWTEDDVWDYIKLRDLPVNPCYKIRQRVGCVFCPFARQKDIRAYCETHPKLKSAFIHAIERYRAKNSDRQKLPTAEDYFEWWLSKTSLKEFIAKKQQTELHFYE